MADPKPGADSGQISNKKLQQTQAQVNEVTNIMRDNVEKVLDRDEKLTNLDERAEALEQGAAHFVKSTHRLKRKYFWQNMKMMIILGVIGLVILIIIIIAFAT